MSEVDHRTTIGNALKMVLDTDKEAAALNDEWCEALFWQLLQVRVREARRAATERHDAQVHLLTIGKAKDGD